MDKRKTLLIDPQFQMRMLARLAGWVTLSTVITAAVVLLFLALSDQGSPGDFFFVVPEAGTHPQLFKRTQIVLPALGVSLIVNLLLSLTFSLFYSQRLAGPIHRMTNDIRRLAQGEKLKTPFHLREGDELQEMAKAFDTLLTSIQEKRKSQGG